MSTRFAMRGPVSGELLSFHGKILVHDNPGELDFLFGGGAKIVQLGTMIPDEDTMPVKSHPELAHINWPLNREDFR